MTVGKLQVDDGLQTLRYGPRCVKNLYAAMAGSGIMEQKANIQPILQTDTAGG